MYLRDGCRWAEEQFIAKKYTARYRKERPPFTRGRFDTFALVSSSCKAEPPLTQGQFDTFAVCLLESLCVGEDGVIGILSAQDVYVSRQGAVVRKSCSELNKVLRVEGPCHTPVQQSQ